MSMVNIEKGDLVDSSLQLHAPSSAELWQRTNTILGESLELLLFYYHAGLCIAIIKMRLFF